jgi:predicted DCC family thiol-disulfide oxidoreductase YuxK
LRGAWPLLYGLVLIPKFIRDAIYRWIAHHRYRWFGQRASCMIPTPDLRARFISF